MRTHRLSSLTLSIFTYLVADIFSFSGINKILISLKKSLQDNPFDSALTLKQASKMLPEKIQELHKTHSSLQNNKESNILPQLQQQINNVLIK